MGVMTIQSQRTKGRTTKVTWTSPVNLTMAMVETMRIAWV
jgi:hypothetical protein